MQYIILFPSIYIINVLTLSTLISFIICKIYNYPFMNEKKYNLLLDSGNIYPIIKTTSSIVVNYNIIYFGFSQYYIEYNEKINLFYSFNDLFSFIRYILILELFFYIYHRITHIPIIYKYTHSYHHKNIHVHPYDSYDIDYVDNVGLLLSLNLPLYFSPLNYYQYTLILFIYGIGSFLIHSNLS